MLRNSLICATLLLLTSSSAHAVGVTAGDGSTAQSVTAYVGNGTIAQEVDVYVGNGTTADCLTCDSGVISLNTGHSLGDMVAAYILEDSEATGTGTDVLDLAGSYDLILSETSATGYTREAGGGVTFAVAGEGKAHGYYKPITGYPFTAVFAFTVPTPVSSVRGINLSQFTSDINSVGVQSSLTTYSAVKETVLVQDYGDTTLIAGESYVMAVVYTSATDREIFLDGSSDSATFTTSAPFPTAVDTLCLGALCRATPAYGDGTIYAAYIYDRALSDTEAQSITGDMYQMINNYSGPE